MSCQVSVLKYSFCLFQMRVLTCLTATLHTTKFASYFSQDGTLGWLIDEYNLYCKKEFLNFHAFILPESIQFYPRMNVISEVIFIKELFCFSCVI